jgi:hypothetical protein
VTPTPTTTESSRAARAVPQQTAVTMRINTLTRVQRRPPVRRPTCGTYRGYYAHYDRGERACDGCKAAVREYQSARAAALPPEVREAKRNRKNARKRALRLLREMAWTGYQALLAEERQALFKEAGPDELALALVNSRAQARAMRRLARLHPDKYEACLAIELAAGRSA